MGNETASSQRPCHFVLCHGGPGRKQGFRSGPAGSGDDLDVGPAVLGASVASAPCLETGAGGGRPKTQHNHPNTIVLDSSNIMWFASLCCVLGPPSFGANLPYEYQRKRDPEKLPKGAPDLPQVRSQQGSQAGSQIRPRWAPKRNPRRGGRPLRVAGKPARAKGSAGPSLPVSGPRWSVPGRRLVGVWPVPAQARPGAAGVSQLRSRPIILQRDARDGCVTRA